MTNGMQVFQDSTASMDSSAEEYLEVDDAFISPHVTGYQSHLLYAKIACWWCAFQLSATSLGSVVLPAQISAILDDPSHEDLYNGFIPAPGAFVSLIVTPIAGIYSDYYQSKFGRRKVFMLAGTIISAIFMIIMGLFNKNTGYNSVYILMFIICLYQFGAQLAAGPYAGLIPDLVHKSRIGIASGWMAVGLAVGSIIGSLGSGVLIMSKTNFWPPYIFLTVCYVVMASGTIFGIKEIPRPSEGVFSWSKVWKQFYLDPKIYKNFYWVILTRTFFDMGIYSIMPFISYFFKDVLQLSNYSFMGSILLGILILMSIPASLTAGHLSDKFGRKNLVYISTVIMMVGIGMMAILAVYPSLAGTYVIGALLGVGYGTYAAVDWALAIDCLPPGANIAKDLGIWHLSVVLPQVIAPVIAGAILSSMKKEYSIAAAYCTTFLYIILWFILAIVFVYPIKVPSKRTKETEKGNFAAVPSSDHN